MVRARSFAVLLAVAALFGSGCNLVGRISIPRIGSETTPGSAPATAPSIADDGLWVAFTSAGGDLVAGDSNGSSDVFVRSLAGRTTTRASLTDADAQSTGTATQPAISGDGRFVAFTSTGSDLVVGDTNGVADVFVRDRVAGTTERVSVATGGTQGSGRSSEPAVSADGRYVSFTSEAANLVASDTNGVADVFVRDRTAATTVRVSVTSAGAQLNQASMASDLSPSGAWAVFTSAATNAVSGDSNNADDVFLARVSGGSVRRVSAPDAITKPFQQSNGASGRAQVTDPVNDYTGGGEPLVAYQSKATNLAGTDANGAVDDVFVTTHLFGTLVRTVRISAAATEGRDPGIGAGGGSSYVVTYRSASGPGTILSVRRDSPISTAGLQADVVSRADDQGAADGPADDPAVSSNGRYVAFTSTATDLLGSTSWASVGDVYVGRTTPVSVTAAEPARVGLLETRDLTVRGSGFEPGAIVLFDRDIVVNSTTFVSAEELLVNVTATGTTPGDTWRSVSVLLPGLGGGRAGVTDGTCVDCVEIAAVVEQPGPVDIEITSIDLLLGTFPLALPTCVGGACPALPATVSPDGELTFGVDSLELAAIPIPVELFPGVETTVEIVPTFTAPSGTVVPVNGTFDLDLGLAFKLRAPLLPSSCALGPVEASLAAGPSVPAPAVAYDQLTGTAVLTGGFTNQLAITGCSFFTGALNDLFGLPVAIVDNAVELGVRLDPILTGTATP